MVKIAYFIKPILLAMINTGIMMIWVFAIKNFLFVQIGFVQFFSLIVGGAIFYFAVAFLFDRHFNYGIYRLIKERTIALSK